MAIPTLSAPTVAPQTTAPSSYSNAVVDTVVRTVPSVTVPPNVNDTFLDPSFGRVIHRITNANTGTTANLSHRTPSSEQACAWGCNSDRFYGVTTKGTVEYFTIDALGVATYVKNLPFTSEPTFSRVSPSIIFGVVGFKIIAYDTDTNTQSTLFDLALVDPTYTANGLVMGSTQSSASTPERLTVFYGGTSQDKHFRVCVFNAANVANRLILDTQAMTINGVPVTMLACHIHAIGLDQSGRYVLVYTTQPDINAGVPQTYVWDTTLGTLTGLTVAGQGHACDGYGVHINKDVQGTWDAIQWQYRSLANVAHPTNVIQSVLRPEVVYESDHGAWNNARADAVTPFGTGVYRFHEDTSRNLSTDPNQRLNTVPWRACDNEILSVHPTTGVISRWCHHFADVYTDDGTNFGSGASFWYQPIPQVSPDGRYILWDSNMLKTLGTDAGSKDTTQQHRTDLFLVDTTQPLSNTGVSITPMTVTRNQPFTVTVASDGIDVMSVELFQNGISQGVKPYVSTGTQYPYANGLPTGSYTFTADAIGSGGTSPVSDSVVLTVAPGIPNKPTITIA